MHGNVKFPQFYLKEKEKTGFSCQIIIQEKAVGC